MAGYTNCLVREFETGEWTVRKLKSGKFVLIVCFPHHLTITDDTYYTEKDKKGWKKSHMIYPGFGPGHMPKLYDSFGLAFAAGKRIPNCKPYPKVSLPLATSDPIHPNQLDDRPAHI